MNEYIERIVEKMKNKTPCSKCPYKLGLVQTLVNPCPNCMENKYNMYNEFLKKQQRKK